MKLSGENNTLTFNNTELKGKDQWKQVQPTVARFFQQTQYMLMLQTPKLDLILFFKDFKTES